MQLPKGKTCADCFHVERCVAFGFTQPTRTMCDFFPSRFMARPVRNPADAQRSGT